MRLLILEQVTGVAPLAARPDKQHTVLFSLLYGSIVFILIKANRSLPLTSPPPTPVIFLYLFQERQARKCLPLLEQVTGVGPAEISLGS